MCKIERSTTKPKKLGKKEEEILTKKGISNSACNLAASVEVEREQLEIYRKNKSVGY